MVIMFNTSLREAVEKQRQATDKEFIDKDIKEGSELDIKLSQEEKENYAGWLNDPITRQVLANLEEEVTRNNVKLLSHCLGTGLDRPVDDRRVLYFSLKNKVIEELLRFLRK